MKSYFYLFLVLIVLSCSDDSNNDETGSSSSGIPFSISVVTTTQSGLTYNHSQTDYLGGKSAPENDVNLSTDLQIGSDVYYNSTPPLLVFGRNYSDSGMQVIGKNFMANQMFQQFCAYSSNHRCEGFITNGNYFITFGDDNSEGLRMFIYDGSGQQTNSNNYKRYVLLGPLLNDATFFNNYLILRHLNYLDGMNDRIVLDVIDLRTGNLLLDNYDINAYSGASVNGESILLTGYNGYKRISYTGNVINEKTTSNIGAIGTINRQGLSNTGVVLQLIDPNFSGTSQGIRMPAVYNFTSDSNDIFSAMAVTNLLGIDRFEVLSYLVGPNLTTAAIAIRYSNSSGNDYKYHLVYLNLENEILYDGPLAGPANIFLR